MKKKTLLTIAAEGCGIVSAVAGIGAAVFNPWHWITATFFLGLMIYFIYRVAKEDV